MILPWTPDEGVLQSTLALLDALHDPTKHNHQQAMLTLNTELGNPLLIHHLIHVFSRMGGVVPLHIRQLAGFVIKTFVFQWETCDVSIQAHISEALLLGLGDHELEIRKAAGIVLAFIARRSPIHTWANIIPPLTQLLDSNALEGALSALLMLCEDCPTKLESYEGGNAFRIIIPRLLSLFVHASPRIRRDAVMCINAVVPILPQGLLVHVPDYLQGLSMLSQDPDSSVRKSVCRGLLLLLEYRPVEVCPALDGVCAFVNKCISDGDENLAKEACDFWLFICGNECYMRYGSRSAGLDSGNGSSNGGSHGIGSGGISASARLSWEQMQHIRTLVKTHVGPLVPVLMARMVYASDELSQRRADAEAQATGEKEVNLKPMHYRGDASGEEDDSEGEQGGGEEDDGGMHWTLRRACALVLEHLSAAFSAEEVVPHALPELEKRLISADVWQRESGILALGVLAQWCSGILYSHMPALHPFLLGCLRESEPELRAISCWTLSKYVTWVLIQSMPDETTGAPGNPALLHELIQALLSASLDSAPTVQEAACSALSAVVNEAPPELVDPLFSLACAHFRQALTVYGQRNYLVLCDTLGYFADKLPESFQSRSDEISPILNNVVSKFCSIESHSVTLIPIMECLIAMVPAARQLFQPYAVTVYDRTLLIISETLAANAALDDGLVSEAPEKDLIVCGLDLVASIAQAFGAAFAELLAIQGQALLGRSGSSSGSGATPEGAGASAFISLAFQCTKDPSPSVRQSAFYVLGEVARNVPALFAPHTESFVRSVLSNLDPCAPHDLVCNNSTWAVGEAATALGTVVISPHAPLVVDSLAQMLYNEDMTTALLANTAIAILRIGEVCPQPTAVAIDGFFDILCTQLEHVIEAEERERAYSGLAMIISAQPSLLSSSENVESFLLACTYKEDEELPAHLTSAIANILVSLRAAAQHEFQKLLSRMDPNARMVLANKYGV